MKNRSLTAAKCGGVAAVAALMFGAIGPADAATQEVSYALGTGTISIPGGDPSSLDLPAATGVVGTWDDATGVFTSTFTSAETTGSRAVTSPVVGTVTQRTQFLAPAGVNGTIDPATGLGSLTAVFNVNIFVESINIGGTVSQINASCHINGVNVTYSVVATGLGTESVIFTNLALTTPTAFTIPAASCTLAGVDSPAISGPLNTSLALPNPGGTSALTLNAGVVPPAPETTTTTIPTTEPPVDATPDPAEPTPAPAHFTG